MYIVQNDQTTKSPFSATNALCELVKTKKESQRPLPVYFNHHKNVTELRIRDVLPPTHGQGTALRAETLLRTNLPSVSTSAQTELSAHRLKNIADGWYVNSLAFVNFITGKCVSAYNGYDEREGAEDVVPVPRDSSADNLSVALSERYVALEKGTVSIMQNPRATKLVGRQEKVVLENGEIELRDVRLSEPEPVSPNQVETMTASSLTRSPDELPDIMHEVLRYQREMGLGGAQDGRLSNAEMLPGIDGRLPQDQHSSIAELKLDGLADSGIPVLDGAARMSAGRSPQSGANEVYDEYITERVEEQKSYLEHEHMHLRSLAEVPEADRMMDLQQDFFLSIMNGVCKKCGNELKRLELKDLFRYKIQHKDEPFSFNPENICCEEFQRVLEKLLFSRGVDRAVRDIRKSQVRLFSPGRKSQSPKSHARGGRKHTSDLGELETITRLLEEESSSSSSDEEEGEEADGTGKKNLKGKFKDRLNSNPARSKGRSISGGQSTVGSIGQGAGIGCKGNGGVHGSFGARSNKFRDKETSYAIVQLPRSSASDSRRSSYTGLKSMSDEVDTRPSIEKDNADNLYLSEKILDVDMIDTSLEDHQSGSHHHTANQSKKQHWHRTLSRPTNFYPYIDGSTACVTAEYAPGLSIVVVLPKTVRVGSGGRPHCPVAAIWDTASWGALIDPNWTPRDSDSGNTVPWKVLKDNKAHHAFKTTHQFNEEAELDMCGRHEIALTVKHEAMRMELNCGFRASKATYTSPSEDGVNRWLAQENTRNQELQKCISVLRGQLGEAEQCAEMALSEVVTVKNKPVSSRRRRPQSRLPAVR